MKKKFHIVISFKENSIVNSPSVRGLNYIALAIYAIGIISYTVDWLKNANFTPTPFTIEMILTAYISTIMVKKVINDTEFYEWDYTERRKKSRFILKYSMLNFLFTSLFLYEIAFVICNYPEIIRYKFLIIVEVSLILWFLFNICNIVSLYYALFEKELKTSYKIQKKPENWQESGSELPEEEPILERLNREFGI